MVHVIFVLTSAVDGIIVACISLLFGAIFASVKSRSISVSFNTIPDGDVCTSTLHVSDTLLAVVAVIVVTPFATPLTNPFSSTIAIPVLSLFQVNALLASVVSGKYVTVNFCVGESVTSSFISFLLNFICVGLVCTFTLHVATFPFAVLAVIIIFPFFSPVTFASELSVPLPTTDAIYKSELDHVISLFTFVVDGTYSITMSLLFGATLGSVKSNVISLNVTFASLIIIPVGDVCTVTTHF